jgi:hypothetical protein
MDITLEKIELVIDRTGVSYKEAKEALEAANGNVVDAIISIEETMNMGAKGKMGAQSSQIIDKLKELVRKGNVSKIVIKKDGEQILNLPVNVGIVGTVIAPWAAVLGVIAAFGTRCVIEVITDVGEVINVSERATDAFVDVKDKGAEFVDGVLEKSAEVIDNMKSRAQNKGESPADQTESYVNDTQEDSNGYVSTSADDSVDSGVENAATGETQNEGWN